MKFVTLFLLLSLSQAFAAQKLSLVGPYLPENMEDNGTSGREAEILRKIFDCMNIKTQIDLQPFVRHIRSYSQSKQVDYDGVLTVPSNTKVKGFPTQPYIKYYNGAIVRDADFPNGISSLKDLKGKDVITFIDGKSLLQGVEGNTSLFSSYVETSNQKTHVEMLLKNRVHAVFSDGLIFMAFYKRILKESPQYKNIPIRFHGVFKATEFFASFKKKAHRDTFNTCLKKLSKDGSLNKIERSYVEPNINQLGPQYLKALIRN